MGNEISGNKEQFWFRQPIADRLGAARDNAGVALESLALRRRSFNSLRRSRLYDDVAALILADESITEIRNLGVRSLREIDAALTPLIEESTTRPPARELVAADQTDLESAIRAFAPLHDFDEMPWYAVPAARRAALAREFRHEPASKLGLSNAATDALHRLPGLDLMGGLIGVGDGIVRRGKLDDAVLREIHSALVRYTRTIAELLDQRDRWLALVDELRGREDLDGYRLADLGVPASLIEILPGPRFDDLRRMSQMEAMRVWADVAVRPLVRSNLFETMERIVKGSGPITAQEWVKSWRALGHQVLPEDYDENGSLPLHVALVKLLRHTIVTSLGEDEWEILQQRKGLLGAKSLTLQQLGDAYGLTRERIRQREARVLRVVAAWLADPGRSVAPARVHPRIERTLSEIRDLFANVEYDPQRHSELLEGLSKVLSCSTLEAEPILDLLAKEAGLAELRLPRRGLESIWTSERDPHRSTIRRIVLKLHDHLTQVLAVSTSGADLAVAINNRAVPSEQITLDEIDRYSPLCSTIQRLHNGHLQGRFEYLGRRAMQFERVLEEAGEPIHLSEILHIFNSYVARYGGKQIQRSNLGNQLATDKRFVPIGRSGLWAMADWPDIETGTLRELMERCLIQHNRPMTAEEIHEWVASLRPAVHPSVMAYLSLDDRFTKIDREHWGLSTWEESQAAQRWNRRGVAEFVAELFSKHALHRMPYAQVRAALMDAADIPQRTAGGMLNNNPAIDTFRDDDGVLQAEFQPGYGKLLEQGGSSPREGTIMRAVRELAAQALLVRPTHAMPLIELRDLLTRELGIPSYSVYSYVARLDELVTEPMPHQRGKLVRWVGSVESDQAESADAVPTVETVDKG